MTINCRGVLLDMNIPIVMGILNLTPDSFYDGDQYIDKSQAITRIDKMILEGANIIDIGGMSSRPGAKIVDPSDEWKRIEKSINYIRTAYPDQLISVDSIHSCTAEKALDKGVQIINDISGGNFDDNMISTVAKYKACFIMMHMRQTPAEMQANTVYPNGLILEILQYFKEGLKKANIHGLQDIILDPGFGFSKTLDQNYKLLNNLHVLKILDKPILAGLSRKSMIYRELGLDPSAALNGTTALHMKALLEGCQILRAHDVLEAVETIKLYNKLLVNV